MRLKVSSAKWRLFCLGLNELTHQEMVTYEQQSKEQQNNMGNSDRRHQDYDYEDICKY